MSTDPTAMHRVQADEALYNAVYAMFLDGAFAQTPAESTDTTDQFVTYLTGAGKDEVVSLLCTAFEQLACAELKIERLSECDLPGPARAILTGDEE